MEERMSEKKAWKLSRTLYLTSKQLMLKNGSFVLEVDNVVSVME